MMTRLLPGPEIIQPQSVRCGLCGADDARLLYEIRLSEVVCKSMWFGEGEYSVGDTARIVQCRRCGLAYTSPRVPFVPGWFPYNTQQETAYFERTRVGRSIAYRNLISQLPNWLGRRPESLLDIGCGDGLLVEHARAADIRGVGLEISKPLVEVIRATLGSDAATLGPLDALAPSSFDIVTLVSVLEHLHDPVGTLRQAATLLKPGGLLLVDVPNLASIAARWRGAHWDQIEPLGHLYYFTPATLRATLVKAGLRVVGRCVVTGRVDLLDTRCSRAKLLLKHAFARAERFTGVSVGYVARRGEG